MNASVTRCLLALGLGVTSLGTGGCGLVLDTAYLISNKRYEETVQERKSTGQTHTAVEYDSALGPDGVVRLTCAERERRIERASSVQKTFERRGSFDSTTYLGTAVLSGVTAGVITGVMAALCTQKPEDPKADQLSCLNMVYASPFVLDVAWSSARYATAKPAKLVEKHTSTAVLALSETPVRTAELRCDSVRLVLGEAVERYEPTAAEILNGAEDRPVRLKDGAIAIPVAPDGTVRLRMQPDVVRAWLDNASLALWMVDGQDRPHSLKVERCGVLRSTADVLPRDAQYKLVQACPPPPPPPQR